MLQLKDFKKKDLLEIITRKMSDLKIKLSPYWYKFHHICCEKNLIANLLPDEINI